MDALKKLCHSCGGHKAHLAKFFDTIESILEKYQGDTTLDSEDRAQLVDYLKQLEHKATVLSDIDKNILDSIEDEHEFESLIVESEDMQSTLSQKMALINHKITTSASDSHPSP